MRNPRVIAYHNGREVSKLAAETWLPQLATGLAWMKSLESLVLIKLGPNATLGDDGESVTSPLLDSLVSNYLTLSRLRRLWIQGFKVTPCPELQSDTPESLQSYRFGEDFFIGGEKLKKFCNIEHLAAYMGVDFARPLQSLQKLKYVSGFSKDDEKVNNAFKNRVLSWVNN